ncbi:MAG: adenylate/guanylate cyclase domain-containing protein [Spirochaetaceae bacterium]|nr:adenylate/guanylate cyclase domain-containing protein [Spirochaetaceae bacterium]
MSGKRLQMYAKSFLHESLLYSGQFALFYLVMQMIIEKGLFFRNPGHVGLLAALVVQTALLAAFGYKALPRAALSFIVPVIYSLFEAFEGSAAIFNAAHIGFWIYAAISMLLNILKLGGAKRERIAEIVLVALNVFIFVFLYFYFDTWNDLLTKDDLTIFRIFSFVPGFLGDPTHWFIIAGGVVLAVTVALGRAEIAALKDRIFALFGKYVDRQVRDIIMREGESEARRLELCVLFSDIQDFTGLCEKHDPTSITKMLNVYFERWNRIVEKHGGIVDKYIGDAIMVVFGLSDSSGACGQAVASAIAMRSEWRDLREDLIAHGLPVPAGFGIGCHFGDLIFGNIGSEKRRNFTVIGDTVNIAARLEAASRTENSELLISSAVYDRLTDSEKSAFSRIGEIELKGKRASVETWGYRESSPVIAPRLR